MTLKGLAFYWIIFLKVDRVKREKMTSVSNRSHFFTIDILCNKSYNFSKEVFIIIEFIFPNLGFVLAGSYVR